jgi:hypothetical protein
MREMDRLSNDVYRDVRLAAEVHRQVRQYAQGIIKPGARLIDICEQLEDMNRKLVKARAHARTHARTHHITSHHIKLRCHSHDVIDIRNVSRRTDCRQALRSRRAARSITWLRTTRPTAATTLCWATTT